MKYRKFGIAFAVIVLIISSLLFVQTFPHWQIRGILNEELPGWFGPGYEIDGPLTIQELEAQSPNVWEAFESLVQEGDEIYYFLSDPASWRGLAGRSGYVLIRNGEIVKMYITLMS